MSLDAIKKELQQLANKDKIAIYKNFHKTSSNGYAHGEIFLGVTCPHMRTVALRNLDISDEDILTLLASNIHEEKYVAAEIIRGKYKSALNEKDKKKIFDFYVNISDKLTGWDLVDTTASQIVGHFIYNYSKDYSIIYKLVKGNLWDRRVAIIATWHFIKNNEYKHTLKISELLLNDTHDLIHKAVGWMLREVGKKDEKILKNFLVKHYKKMPRTMLRYAIEKFSAETRKKYLLGEI